MRYLLIFALSIIIFACDDSGQKEWETPITSTSWDTVPTIIMDSAVVEEPVAVTNMELKINLAQIAGADAPTRVVVTADLQDGRIIGYSVTTSASKKALPKPHVEKSDVCASCYTIKAGDTKTSLARHFNISQSQIKNKTLIIGQKLIVE